jgi:hypothetical protein
MPFFIPGILRGILLDFVRSTLADGSSQFSQKVDRYILNPEGLIGPHPLLQEAPIQEMYRIASGIVMSLLVVLLMYTCLRSMLERSFRARYTLKVMLPRIMLLIALLTVGLLLINGAVDLNRAIANKLWSAPLSGQSACWSRVTPNGDGHGLWCAFMTQTFGENLVLGLLFLLLCGMLVVLVFVGVVRGVLIAILAIVAPFAFACLVLPETRSYALAWRRLFFTTVFSHAIQVMILRFALLVTFQDSVSSVIHGLVAMYVVLKVPSALHAASSTESKVMTHMRHLEHAVHSAIDHAVSPPRARVRAHSAA